MGGYGFDGDIYSILNDIDSDIRDMDEELSVLKDWSDCCTDILNDNIMATHEVKDSLDKVYNNVQEVTLVIAEKVEELIDEHNNVVNNIYNFNDRFNELIKSFNNLTEIVYKTVSILLENNLIETELDNPMKLYDSDRKRVEYYLDLRGFNGYE